MLKNELESYLDDISHLADATVASHKSTLTKFVKECQTHNITTEDLTPQWIAEHLTGLAANLNLHAATIHGKISTLANFTAYVQNVDPGLLRTKILNQMGESSKHSIDNPGTTIKTIKFNDDLNTKIETYLHHVRKKAYGTRVHAATEIFVRTGCRIGAFRGINLGDLNLDQGELDLTQPKTHAVGKTDSKVTRTIVLPEKTVRVLRTYIEHERIPTDNDDAEAPLFTTHNGRVSAATLTRSIKAAMSEALGTDETADESDPDDTQVDSVTHRYLSLRSLRKYYLSQHIEE